jgi:hypothetical protein
MAVRLGNVLFWASILIAASVFLVGRGITPDDMSLAYGIAVVALLIGWACKYVLGGKRGP